MPLVDAFCYTDHIINSPLGRYDGDGASARGPFLLMCVEWRWLIRGCWRRVEVYVAYFNQVRNANPLPKVHPYFERLIKPLIDREPCVEPFIFFLPCLFLRSASTFGNKHSRKPVAPRRLEMEDPSEVGLEDDLEEMMGEGREEEEAEAESEDRRGGEKERAEGAAAVTGGQAEAEPDMGRGEEKERGEG